ncbi:MAG TPA: DUF5615 family PIN-like protein [Vineibacter sp.]|nr:DUF5615 family PIN-like protein [Vineibacter sp.]
MLDACVPHWLRRELGAADVTTARYAGLDELSDSDLLAAVDGRYDVLVTLDQNMSFQQNLAGRRLAVIVLHPADQSPESFRALVLALIEALADVVPGEVRRVG